MNIRNEKLFYIILTIVISVSTLVDYILAGPNQFISILSPSIGVALTYYFFKEKSIAVPILLVYACTLFSSRTFFIQEAFHITLLVVVFKTTVLYVMMLLFKFLMKTVKNNGYDYINVRDSLNYIVIGFIVSFIGATFYVFPIHYVFDYSNNLFWYGNTWIGHMFGFYIFGGALHFSLLNDDNKNYNQRRFYSGVIFVLIVSIVSYIIFSDDYPWMSFHNFSYLFVVFYSIAIIFFQFSIVFIMNYVIFALYSIYHYNHSTEFDLSQELFSIILILLVLTSSATLIRLYLLKAQNKELETETMNESLKDLMFASNDLLRNLDNFTSDRETFSNLFLTRMFRIGCNVLGKFDMASLFIKKDGYIKYLDAYGYDVDYLNTFKIEEDKFVWTYKKPGIVVAENELYAETYMERHDYIDSYPMIRQSMRLTIFYNNEAVAGMSFDITTKNNENFNHEDVFSYNEFQTMINSYYNLAVIHNANNALRNDIVTSLVRALGLYDSYTGQHSEEVAFLGIEIARKLDLPIEQTNRIYWSAIVHDIGKIGIKDSVLNKKGVFTIDEKKLVEEHTTFGYNVLNQTAGLKDVAVRVKHHHERWDGLGYPDGLKGKEIPLCSQILAVCDAVSAMSQNRVYSKAKSVDEIIGELYIEKGKQFSPIVADAMIEYIQETKLIDYYKRTK